MSLSRVAVRRPVLTTVVVSVFLVLGLFSYLGLVVDLFPDVEFPFVTVTTIYPGTLPLGRGAGLWPGIGLNRELALLGFLLQLHPLLRIGELSHQ